MVTFNLQTTIYDGRIAIKNTRRLWKRAGFTADRVSSTAALLVRCSQPSVATRCGMLQLPFLAMLPRTTATRNWTRAKRWNTGTRRKLFYCFYVSCCFLLPHKQIGKPGFLNNVPHCWDGGFDAIRKTWTLCSAFCQWCFHHVELKNRIAILPPILQL